MSPPSVAHGDANAMLNHAYHAGGPIPDVETGAFRAALRAKMAMKAHQDNDQMVTAQEVGEQLAFAVKESLAAVGGQNGVPSEIPPALTAVLANLNGTLIQLEKKVEEVKVQMKEQGDDVQGQLSQLKGQLSQLEKKAEEVKVQMKEQGGQLSQLKGQLSQLEKKAEEVKVQMKEQGDDVQGQLSQLEKKVEEVKVQMKEQGDDVQGQLSQLNEQGDDVQGQLSQLNEQIAFINDKLAVVELRLAAARQRRHASLTSPGGSSQSRTRMAAALPEFTFGSAPSNNDNDETGATPSTARSPGRDDSGCLSSLIRILFPWRHHI